MKQNESRIYENADERTDVPAYDDKGTDEDGDVNTHDDHKPVRVAVSDVWRHVAEKPPQLSDRTLNAVTTGWSKNQSLTTYQ